MKKIIIILAVPLMLAACVKDEFPVRDPSDPVEIVECKPGEVCQ